MYARTSTVKGSPDRIDQGIAMVRDEVLPRVTSLPGCLGLSMLVDREAGHGIVTTSWDTLESLRASEPSIAPMREAAEQLLQGKAEVEEWEISVMHREKHTPEGSYARTTWLALPDIDRAHDVFKLVVLGRVQEYEHFCSGVLMVNRETGRGVSTVVFDSKAGIEETRETAAEVRAEASKASGSTILDVREHELVLAHLHVPELA